MQRAAGGRCSACSPQVRRIMEGGARARFLMPAVREFSARFFDGVQYWARLARQCCQGNGTGGAAAGRAPGVIESLQQARHNLEELPSQCSCRAGAGCMSYSLGRRIWPSVATDEERWGLYRSKAGKAALSLDGAHAGVPGALSSGLLAKTDALVFPPSSGKGGHWHPGPPCWWLMSCRYPRRV